MEAKQVPLYEQLEDVPLDARLVIDDSDGMGATILAIGRMCHGAATALRTAIEQAEKPVIKRKWVGLTDQDWKQLWDEFDSLDIENDFQDHMVGKYGEGHYTDADMYWQFQQQMIKQMVNAKLEEKNSG